MISGKWRLVQDFFALDGRDIRRIIYEPTHPIPNPIIPNHSFVICLRQKSSVWLLTNCQHLNQSSQTILQSCIHNYVRKDANFNGQLLALN